MVIKALLLEIAQLVGPDRFYREIQFLRQLSHPRIVPILESSEKGPVLFYTMPLIQGHDLREVILSTGPMAADRVLEIARDIAAALDHAHGQNILHRDIKPENILLEGEHALVCDFGIARAIERAGGEQLSSSGLLLGTPGYMSPEQARGRTDLDVRCDIYAFAAVLFEMLSGEPAIAGQTAQAVMARQAANEISSLQVLRPDLPPAVESILRQALAKDPLKRPASGAELLDQLQAAFSSPLDPESETGR